MKRLSLHFILILAVICLFSNSALALTLTSFTIDAEDRNGASLNAPGGIFTTNLADPFTQLGVMANGAFLNTPGNGLDLGEISIDLLPGINIFSLYGTTAYIQSFYGATLFFDGEVSAPQIAVYNENGSPGDFLVQAQGTTVAGSANGGLLWTPAPGSSVFVAQDGSSVEVMGFTVDNLSRTTDMVSWGNIGTDGIPDLTAEIILNYTPVPEPATIFLLGSGLFGIFLSGSRKKTRV